MKYLTKIIQKNKNTYTIGADIKESFSDGVYAVYADGKAFTVLDPEFAMSIDIDFEEEIASYMANFKCNPYWCRPFFGNSLNDIPDETQLLLAKTQSGEYISVLPVVSEKYKCVLKGTENGLCARLYSWYDKLAYCKGLAFVYAKGNDPYSLVQKCYDHALEILNNGTRRRDERRYPEIFEYLGWCSWDSFQIRVNEQGILDKCLEFKEKEIPVKWILFDDMWAEVEEFYGAKYNNKTEMFGIMHRSSLYSFEADHERFPNGLKGAISKIKKLGFGVGMWLPTTGYWNGINPDGEAYEQTKEYLTVAPDGQIIHNYKLLDAFMYYKLSFDFLRKCGADFIKIDNQSKTNNMYKGMAPIGISSREFHEAMEAAAGYHFDNALINCMGMSSEDMWNRPISPITRCSDDFEPENKEYFIRHLMQCSYNSFAQGPLYWCDWDMWWTDDGQALKNSVLRAISGGPIYVSDQPGRSMPELLKPLVLNNGRILRCDRPAAPTADCLTIDPETSGKILKIQNICDESGVMAIYNVSKDNTPVYGTLSPSDVTGLYGESFAVYEHFTKELKILDKNDCMDITLSSIDEFKLYIIVPVKDGFAPIGLVDKFISPRTIKHIQGRNIVTYDKGTCAYVEEGELKFIES